MAFQAGTGPSRGAGLGLPGWRNQFIRFQVLASVLRGGAGSWRLSNPVIQVNKILILQWQSWRTLPDTHFQSPCQQGTLRPREERCLPKATEEGGGRAGASNLPSQSPRLDLAWLSQLPSHHPKARPSGLPAPWLPVCRQVSQCPRGENVWKLGRGTSIGILRTLGR